MVNEVLVEGLGEGLVSYVFATSYSPSAWSSKRGEPSCVGRVPPIVITRSSVLIRVLLASMLKTCDAQFSPSSVILGMIQESVDSKRGNPII